MDIQLKTALVLGSTGLIGNQLLALLLNDPAYGKVVALSRKHIDIIHPKLEVNIIDFADENSYRENIPEGDVIFCCIGTTMKQVKGDRQRYRQIDFDIPVQAARWGLEKGYSQYLLVSAIGASADASNFYLRLKGETEDAIAALPYTAVHIFRPSLLLGDRKESRPMEKAAQILSPVLSLLMIGSLKHYRPIQSKTVARAMLAASETDTTGVHVYAFSEIKALTN